MVAFSDESPLFEGFDVFDYRWETESEDCKKIDEM